MGTVPLVLAGLTHASTTAGVTFDRTMRCDLVTYGGAGDLDIVSSPRFKTQFGQWIPAYLGVGSGPQSQTSSLVFVRAFGQMGEDYWQGVPPGPPGAYAQTFRCAPTSAKLPLARTGLSRHPRMFTTGFSCPAGTAVLVRLRVHLRTATFWADVVEAPYGGADGAVDQAAIAVRTIRGAPLAYMTLDRKRTANWSARACR